MGRGRRLSRWLLRLLEEAGLTNMGWRQPYEDQRVWVSKLRNVTGQFMVAPGRGLSQWWFPYPGEWHRKRVHARLHAAAGEWPRGYRPQAFLSRVAEVVEAHAVDKEGRESRVEVVNRIGRPMVGRNAVSGPYLFIGVVGRGGPRRGYECVQGWAQPIVSWGCPVPVDSHYERRAFGTLLVTGEIVEKSFPGAEVVIEKPVFDHRDTGRAVSA